MLDITCFAGDLLRGRQARYRNENADSPKHCLLIHLVFTD
jgi:hypothetical protein